MKKIFRTPVPALLVFAASLMLVLAGAAPAAAAKFTVTATVQADGTAQRVVVVVSSATSPSAKQRPRSVKVKAAGKMIKLSKFTAGAAAAAGYTSSWRSGKFTGSFATKLAGVNGKRVPVTLISRSRTSKLNTTITVVAPGGGAPPPATQGPLFAPPPAPLTGNDAAIYLSKWFLNSAFSDCAGVWPTCAVEERYVHCPSGAWEYHRTAGTSADIDAYDNFSVTGADVFADGSWAVKYVIPSSGAIYVWKVSTTGIATGQYTFGTTSYGLGPMYWSQPAITWQKPAGAC